MWGKQIGSAKKKKNTCRHERVAAGVKSSLATGQLPHVATPKQTCTFIPVAGEGLKACDGKVFSSTLTQ